MKYAICQELFVDWDWERQCRFIAEVGYTGIEVAPFTLGATPADVAPARRRELRRIAADHGLEIVGLHWLLAKTEGLHLTSADAACRARTADYLRALSDLCADLGGGLMVLGSPQQRNLEPNVDKARGVEHALEIFQKILPHLAEREVTLLMEPLTTRETDFCNTCAEAAEMVARLDHPRFGLHQDVKAMLGEGTDVPSLIRQYADITGHFHANDSNLLGPGMGETDYVPIFTALHEVGYGGWVSVEVFDYSPGAEEIAEKSLQNMQATWRQVSGAAS